MEQLRSLSARAHATKACDLFRSAANEPDPKRAEAHYLNGLKARERALKAFVIHPAAVRRADVPYDNPQVIHQRLELMDKLAEAARKAHPEFELQEAKLPPTLLARLRTRLRTAIAGIRRARTRP